ncbi:homocysteine S-methyltransferase [Paenibacillus sp. UMB7766-LJ446]|uniref:Homocysteine S-methyltransferase n=1 Tax=Paenibacillus vandeheii TaxID=3035917 RepID=A0ABT8JIP9_9BACL|nr:MULTISPECIES: homocysteine S-methyltransferase [Paenibacillus]MDK8193525.1 homocysteine S-methyltransferase [Paenibacillus sp. UMB7766-LJ446]MDN4604307.1 homocysteine S-methyltransferase [Paenibacillus vandeheii]
MTQAQQTNPIEQILRKHPVMILDGALATELEQHGCDLDDPLWSARVLLENPDVIVQVHADYFRAGADCAITSSYQATVDGFRKRGIGEQEALDLIRKTVQLAAQARDDVWAEVQDGGFENTAVKPEGNLVIGTERQTSDLETGVLARPRPMVAASVGPYGAYLADGSEYVGHYGVSDETLSAFHRPRITALLEAGADILAFETIPSLQEAQVLIALLKEFPNAYAWLSFSLKDGTAISEGTPLEECARLLGAEPQLAAIGLNCAPMELVTEAVGILSRASDKPVIVYPNSGEVYDAATKTWSGQGTCGSMSDASEAWVAAGAKIIGGCCRTTPHQIGELAKKWRS